MARKVPPAVWVIVGDIPVVQLDGPGIVRIDPSDDVRSLDLRPLVGLHVDVFELGDHQALFDLTAKVIDAAKVKTTGLANRHGVSGVSDAHERVLKRTMELLCKS